MKLWPSTSLQVRENYSAMTQSTVSRYVIVVLLLGNVTLLHMLPQVMQCFLNIQTSKASISVRGPR